ncbi:MAG TPA: phage holin family protein [candidate division Zixibacteria bacterium]|nr:phage holin family protein [candidate division Zixibacteria bacterium]
MASRATNTYRTNNTYNEKPIGQLFAETRDELKEFIVTRVQMLRTEMSEKAAVVKTAAPMIVVGAVLGVFSVLLLTVALVAIIAVAFMPAEWAWAAAFAIVGVVYALAGGLFALYGIRTLQARSMKPERTLRILKRDQEWFRTEAKTGL